jgi:DNA replication protein DnaC
MARTRQRTTAADPVHELVQLAIDLDLTALAEAFPELLHNAEKDSPSFTDFALQMLRTEATTRKQRRLERSLKRSHLGSVQGLDGFNFDARPRLDPRVVKELLNCQFVDQHRNVLCLGRPGLGKTRIAKALAHAACLRGYSVLYVRAVDMIEDMHASLADGTFKPFSTEATNYLFRIVSARHQNGSIVLTANTGFKRWKNFFPSEATAVATVDRLVDDATILRFTGKSFRPPREIVGAPLDDDE